MKHLFSTGQLSLFPDIFIPKGILWYLVCLLLWRLIVVIAKEELLKRYKWYVLLFFFVSGLEIGFIRVQNGTIIRFFTLGVFFFMGYYSNEQHLKTFLQRIPVWSAIVLLFVMWLSVFFLLNIDLRSVI